MQTVAAAVFAKRKLEISQIIILQSLPHLQFVRDSVLFVCASKLFMDHNHSLMITYQSIQIQIKLCLDR